MGTEVSWSHQEGSQTEDLVQVFSKEQHGPGLSHITIFFQLTLAVFLAQVLGTNTE